jgi:NADPH:quinone reductase-like Zn-dependent oxidoreductase
VFGLNPWLPGAHAEFACVPSQGLIAPKPAGPSFAHAAAVCDGGLNALACLRRARVR